MVDGAPAARHRLAARTAAAAEAPEQRTMAAAAVMTAALRQDHHGKDQQGRELTQAHGRNPLIGRVREGKRDLTSLRVTGGRNGAMVQSRTSVRHSKYAHDPTRSNFPNAN
jgi:hypothetical protein